MKRCEEDASSQMMQAELLIIWAAEPSVNNMELLSNSRSMGTPKSLCTVQPSIRVAAMPVEAHAQMVRPRDASVLYKVL